MGETSRNQRARVRGWIADGAPESCDMGVYEQALGCINDADRLAEAEALLRESQSELKETLDSIGGCDHDVGACVCELVDLIERNDAFLSGGR